VDGNRVGAAAAVDDDGDVNVNFISFLLFSHYKNVHRYSKQRK